MAERRGPRFSRPIRLRGEEQRELTARQAQIMDLLASGMRQKEIAEELNIAVETVKNHLGIIYLKLDVHTAARAVLAWNERKKGQ